MLGKPRIEPFEETLKRKLSGVSVADVTLAGGDVKLLNDLSNDTPMSYTPIQTKEQEYNTNSYITDIQNVNTQNNQNYAPVNTQNDQNYTPVNTQNDQNYVPVNETQGTKKIVRAIKTQKGFENPITGIIGNKATRNNNPGNITGMGGKLLYGAIAIAKDKGGDKGDQSQLVFKTPTDGFIAMINLIEKRYSNGVIAKAFKKYQTDMTSFMKKLRDIRKYVGIDPTKVSFKDLSPVQKRQFIKIWAQHEGWRGDWRHLDEAVMRKYGINLASK